VSGPHSDGSAHVEHPDGTIESAVASKRRAAAEIVHDKAEWWFLRRAAERWRSEGPL